MLTSLISLTNEGAKNNCVTPPFNPFIYVPENIYLNGVWGRKSFLL